MDEERRLLLHERLVAAAGPGVRVYFQPPSDVTMVYPCIRYQRGRTDTEFAGNLPYLLSGKYTVTVMDSDPKSEIPTRVARLPMCSHSASYPANNLNHDVFDIYV